MTSHDPYISHGRGGAANIKPDPTPYADAGITREGPVGDQGDGPWSSGRGGTGNIGSPATGRSPAITATKGKEPVPATNNLPDGALAGPTATGNATTTTGTGTASAIGDADYVPEQNVREAPETYHIGRGGEGNAQHAKVKEGEKVHVHEGAAERFKQKIFGKGSKP